MNTHIAEVLARESACLAGVTDGAKLADWRSRVIKELMTPSSPYARALRQTGDASDRADFLDRWCELIAEALERLLRSCARGGVRCTSAQTVDVQKTAVLILAALHGGSTLSAVEQDPRPLNAALDLALARFAATGDSSGGTFGKD
jgi:hypothetical protein